MSQDSHSPAHGAVPPLYVLVAMLSEGGVRLQSPSDRGHWAASEPEQETFLILPVNA